MINGRLSNCYSLKDYVLKYILVKMNGRKPIGLQEILNNFEDLNGSKCLKNAHNYDFTIECPGHMTYMKNCNLILEKISYAY